MSYEALIYTLFAASLAIPALPAAMELRSKRDAGALRIDAEYAADPRYFGNSFRRKIAPLLVNAKAGSRIAFLGRANEQAQILDALEVPASGNATDALLVRADVRVGARARLTDVYSAGSVQACSGSSLQAIVANGHVFLDENVRVARWIDANGNITAGEGCRLGHSAAAGGSCALAPRVEFRRLFGNPVAAGAHIELPEPQQETQAAVTRDIISPQNVEIAAASQHHASIKSGGEVSVGEGARVWGNIVARGRVHIERSARVHGHVFSERAIHIGENAVIAAPGHAKTVHSSGEVTLAPGAIVYGWIICEGRGTTL